MGRCRRALHCRLEAEMVQPGAIASRRCEGDSPLSCVAVVGTTTGTSTG